MRKKTLTLFLLIAFAGELLAQVRLLPFSHHDIYEKQLYSDTTGTVHTSLRPVLRGEESGNDDSLFFRNADGWKVLNGSSLRWELKPLVYTGLNLNSENTGNHFSAGAGISQTLLYKSHLAATFSIMPVTSSFDTMITKGIDSTMVIPHECGFLSKSGNRYNYLALRGGLSWKTASWFHLFAGYDKTFFGDGIRSLFWSDNAGPYWQVRATVLTRRISYVMLYSFLKDDNNDYEGITFQNKYASAHYLNWNIGRRLQFSFFEAVVWRGNDSLAFRGYDVNYMNPIVFFRPVEFNLGSPDNVIMGLGGRLRLFKTLHLYGQLVFDEFKLSEIKARTGWWANKYGLLAGMRSFINLPGNSFIHLQAEISGVRPFTYSHINSMENLGNCMQPIAHPLGANFRDIWFRASYNRKQWTYSLTVNNAFNGTDSLNKNMGFNIYRSYFDSRNEYGNKWLQGIPRERTTVELKCTWWAALRANLAVEGGLRFFNMSDDRRKSSEIQFFTGVVTRF
jgi:hypothetical protein